MPPVELNPEEPKPARAAVEKQPFRDGSEVQRNIKKIEAKLQEGETNLAGEVADDAVAAVIKFGFA